MTTIEILTSAKALITDPARWTQGSLAKDKDGMVVFVHDPHATCFCAAGAIMKADGPLDEDEPNPIEVMRRACGEYLIGSYNDKVTHKQILKTFDKAIEMVKHGLFRY